MEITLPEAVTLILNRLERSGFEAYVVGGCVRDSIMGIPPHDWDVCTSALPEQTIETFSDKKVIPTGLKHGTVTVVIDDCEYEITTYRHDGKYSDNRHPDSVEFATNLREDLKRRDFTINALAYNPKSGIIDYFNGVDDIRNKIIRCVGNPDERFSEDALRIMRAVRFAIRYGFEIETNTRDSIMLHRISLINISAERINAELTKALQSFLFDKSPQLFCDLITLLGIVAPELMDINVNDISWRLCNSISDLEVRLALLFNFENDELENALRRLRFSNDIIKSVIIIGKYGRRIITDNTWIMPVMKSIQNKVYNKTDYFERRILHEIGYTLFVKSIFFACAFYKPLSQERILLNTLHRRISECPEDYPLSDLAVNGNDLIDLGYCGKQIGDVLNTLLDMVMRNVVRNDHDKLIQIAKSIKENLL